MTKEYRFYGINSGKLLNKQWLFKIENNKPWWVTDILIYRVVTIDYLKCSVCNNEKYEIYKEVRK